MTTSPATTPEQNPRTEACFLVINSRMPHVNEATAAASVVVMKAFDAIPSAEPALPALKPYQPTQSMPVPTMQSTMLCGGIGVFPNPIRGPRMTHSTSADHPELMCTTVPPAKSIALIVPAAPAIKPPPQTMCASGKYTANIHSATNSSTAENFMRSAIAPTISAGVMMANVSWKIAKTFCDTHGKVLGALSTPLKNMKSVPPITALPGANERLKPIAHQRIVTIPAMP